MSTPNVQIEHKKGEVNELKASLRNPAIERDAEKKREVVKRVIAYMTLGIDVSKLFSEMIMVRRKQRVGGRNDRGGAEWGRGGGGEAVCQALCREEDEGLVAGRRGGAGACWRASRSYGWT